MIGAVLTSTPPTNKASNARKNALLRSIESKPLAVFTDYLHRYSAA